MYNSEPVQPNEWNMYLVISAEIPSEDWNLARAKNIDDSDPNPIPFSCQEGVQNLQDERQEMAFSNH